MGLGCDPGGIQTPDFKNRNLTFYSAELRGQKTEGKSTRILRGMQGSNLSSDHIIQGFYR